MRETTDSSSQEREPSYGSITPPIHQTSTFVQPAPGEFAEDYDYSRSANPTRAALERALGELETGHASAYASGMAATHAALTAMLRAGDHLILPADLYGGTYRLVDKVLAKFGLAYDLVDFLWWMLGFVLFSTWICLFVVVLRHIMGRQDLSGGGKAFWLVCLIVVPLIVALAYVITRRGRITTWQPEVDRQEQAASRGYGRDSAVASPRTPAVDVARLAELHDRGLLTDDEYVRQRMRAIS